MWEHRMWEHRMWEHRMWEHRMWEHRMWEHRMWEHRMWEHRMWEHRMWEHRMWEHDMGACAPQNSCNLATELLKKPFEEHSHLNSLAMLSAFRTTVQEGHPDVIQQLQENHTYYACGCGCQNKTHTPNGMPGYITVFPMSIIPTMLIDA